MGFENRKSTRVKLESMVCYWADGDTKGPGVWGRCINVSDSGMAFHASKAVAKQELMLVEFSLPGGAHPLRLFSEVVFSEPAPGEEWQLRVKFVEIQAEEQMILKQFIFKSANPKLAAATGWGKAAFEGLPPFEATYRELTPAEQKQMMDDKSFVGLKEASYLKNFLEFLNHEMGVKLPGAFKLAGTKTLKDKSPVWVEITLSNTLLHGLGEVLWSHGDNGGPGEAGLQFTAFKKDEAVRLEKAMAPKPEG